MFSTTLFSVANESSAICLCIKTEVWGQPFEIKWDYGQKVVAESSHDFV
jgi:hypothetical protein